MTELKKCYKTNDDHQLFNFTAFPFVKKLILKNSLDYRYGSVLSVERMNAVTEQIAKMSRLQSLELCDLVREFIGIIANHQEVNRRTKYLYVDQRKSGVQARARFLAAIESFEHLQFLKVLMPEVQDPIDNLNVHSIIGMRSNLNGLDFYDGGLGIEMAIIQAIGHQLHYLTFHCIDKNASYALKDVNFSNLQQLVQGRRCYDDSLRFILKTAVNLEKVDVNCKRELIADILTQCEKLKYLKIHCDYEKMREVLDVMAHCFEQKKNACKQTLKIRIHSYWRDEGGEVVSFENIVSSLSASKVNQWMIILYLSVTDAHKIRSRDELLRKLIWDRDVARSFEVDNVFVITDPECIINGISESWLM